MSDETTIWTELWRSAAANATLAAVAWGAAGGATSALVVRVSLRDALRQVILGALAAGGMGSVGGAVIAAWLELPAGAIPAIGAGGSVAYLVGVFGPAILEVLLARIRGGRAPGA